MNINFETDFANVNHVNQLGAEKYTEFLSEYIKTKYDLPDHRKENGYENWDKLAVAFSAECENWKTEIEDTISNHMRAREIGNRLPTITDAKEWFSQISNENFTVIIEKSKTVDLANGNEETLELLSPWIEEAALGDVNYIKIWSNGNIYSYCGGEDDSASEIIGVNGSRGHKRCNISTGNTPSIIIGTEQCIEASEGAHFVVFDNNYWKIWDCATISLNKDGEIEIIHTYKE